MNHIIVHSLWLPYFFAFYTMKLSLAQTVTTKNSVFSFKIQSLSLNFIPNDAADLYKFIKIVHLEIYSSTW